MRSDTAKFFKVYEKKWPGNLKITQVLLKAINIKIPLFADVINYTWDNEHRIDRVSVDLAQIEKSINTRKLQVEIEIKVFKGLDETDEGFDSRSGESFPTSVYEKEFQQIKLTDLLIRTVDAVFLEEEILKQGMEKREYKKSKRKRETTKEVLLKYFRNPKYQREMLKGQNLIKERLLNIYQEDPEKYCDVESRLSRTAVLEIIADNKSDFNPKNLN